ncbi:MAG: hypothetical protein FWE20_10150 [Defluviitaleaceae bacterium]|nr:hypothetical protein [Defluviitaleaceae bacterium]
MADILNIFDAALNHVLADYADHRFILERDFVWTLQKQLLGILDAEHGQYTVFNDYPIERGKLNRGISADLVIIKKAVTRECVLSGAAQVELAAEFKFEPSPKRTDICGFKLPVVFWPSVVRDVERVRKFTEDNKARIGIAIFIDEHGRYRNEKRYSIGCHSEWRHLGNFNTDYLDVQMLYTVSK